MSRMKNWEKLVLKGSHFAQKRGFVGTKKAFLEPTRPPKEKKNRKTYFAIVCITVSFGAHGLGKDVAYNADDRAGPHAPH